MEGSWGGKGKIYTIPRTDSPHHTDRLKGRMYYLGDILIKHGMFNGLK